MNRVRSSVADTNACKRKVCIPASTSSRALFAVFPAVLLALFCAPARAQAPKAGGEASKVHSVQFSGSSRFAEDVLARSIGLAPGTVVVRKDIERAADQLGKMGWFSELNYRFDTTPKGVDIQFTLRDAPCHPVWFDNFPWFTDAEMGNAIRATGLPYDGTAPETGTALDTFREAIAGLLKSKNISGEVEGELVQAPESSSLVERFRVTPNEVFVTSLTFSDEIARNDLRVADVLDTIVHKSYSRYTLAIFVFEHLRPAYTSKGYLRVRFGEPVAEFVGDPTKPLSNEISLRLPIEPGVQYHWGGVEWSGQLALDAATLNRLMGFAPTEPLDELKLQAGWDAITHEYARRGYLEAKVEPTARYNDADARVSYTARVVEGIQYRMGQLVLTGLSLTAERQLLSNWRLARGDVFDNNYFEDFLNGGANEIFKNTPVHFQHIGHLLKPNPQTKTVDVMLDFQ
ncbi:MAG TPA: POTRA domain-containing protein [Candidatus Solibacter sp.]|nr:POTRA domain-containing protein [Candidatus Solibacter sp.]